MSVEELEVAIAQLAPDDLDRLAHWLMEFYAQAWDQQLESDAQAGKLDRLSRRPKEDFASGKCTPI